MVTTITNFGRSGTYDWLIQRASAVILGVYTIFLFAYFVFSGDISYVEWKSLFEATWMRIFSLLALIALGAHAWIGMWTVATDYLHNGFVKFIAQAAGGVILFVYVVWGIQILWGL